MGEGGIFFSTFVLLLKKKKLMWWYFYWFPCFQLFWSYMRRKFHAGKSGSVASKQKRVPKFCKIHEIKDRKMSILSARASVNWKNCNFFNFRFSLEPRERLIQRFVGGLECSHGPHTYLHPLAEPFANLQTPNIDNHIKIYIQIAAFFKPHTHTHSLQLTSAQLILNQNPI